MKYFLPGSSKFFVKEKKNPLGEKSFSLFVSISRVKMSSISDPYNLVQLPQVLDRPLKSRLSVATNSGKDGKLADDLQDTVNFGISYSSISSYTLYPSPNLLWSESISLLSKVTALATYTNNNEEKENSNASSSKRQDDRIFAVGLNDRNRFSIRYIVSSKDKPTVTKSFSFASFATHSASVTSLLFSKTGKSVYTLYSNGKIQNLKFDLDAISSTQKPVPPTLSNWVLGNKTASVVYHKFIKNNSSPGIDDGMLLYVGKPWNSASLSYSSTSFVVKLVSLNEQQGFIIAEKEFTFSREETIGTFAYHFNTLYRFATETATITGYKIPSGEVIGTTYLRSLISNGNVSPDSISLKALGVENRVLLSHGNQLFLIDSKYSSVLFTKTLESPIILLSHDISEQKLKSKSKLKPKPNTVLSLSSIKNKLTVQAFTINFGSATLLESLFKGVPKSSNQQNKNKNSLPDILPTTQEKSLSDFNYLKSGYINEQNSSSHKILKAIYRKRKAKDVDGFEHLVLTYLTTGKFDLIEKKKEKLKHIVYSEDDYQVDSSLIYMIVSYIFTNSDNSEPFRKFSEPSLYRDFVPRKTLVYLLTHPLFPTCCFDNLLDILAPFPQISRQALVTCPQLSVEQLLTKLSNSKDEVFKDIMTRLTEEFPKESLSQNIRSLTARRDSAKVISWVKRMVKLDCGWSIMSCFVDSVGLFSWTPSLIDEITVELKVKEESIMSNTYSITLLEETIKLLDPEVGLSTKADKKKQRRNKKPTVVTQDMRQKEQFKSLLAFNADKENAAAAAKNKEQETRVKKKVLVKRGLEISRNVPTYSVEQLIM